MKQCNLYNIEAEFKKYLSSSNFSRTSINNYLADFRHFLSWLILSLRNQGLIFEAKHLNSKTFSLYKKSLESENLPVKSINRRLSAIRTFIRFCMTQGWMENNPLSEINNIKTPPFESFYFFIKSRFFIIISFLFGLFFILMLFILPLFVLKDAPIFSNRLANLTNKNIPDSSISFDSKYIASTSAGILNIPVIDQRGNLNLSSPYSKIIGLSGTLTIESKGLELKSLDKGYINISLQSGSAIFSFDDLKPPLPFEAAFNFSARNLIRGTLIYGETEEEGEKIRLLELTSGSPKETKFSVDADGNVHIKGNVIIEGNIIMNPQSVIFGRMTSETATSSRSPEP